MNGLRNGRTVLVGGALVVGLIVGFIATQVFAATGTVRIGSATAVVGGAAVVNVEALTITAPGLGAWTIDVRYDPLIVTAVACAPDQGGVCNSAFAANVVRAVGANAAGLQGDSTLAAVTFACEAVGTTNLVLDVSVFVDSNPGNPQDITFSLQQGSITCTEGAPPTATPTPTLPVPPAGGLSCLNFAFQEEAQAALGANPTLIQLDPDGDGIACEDLPSRPWRAGAVYQGPISGGGTVQIRVSSDGLGISAISISGLETPCATITQQATVSPPVRIQTEPVGINFFSHRFLAGPTESPLDIAVFGRFAGDGTVDGTIVLFSADDPVCEDTTLFVAALTSAPAPPPPQAPPSGGPTVSGRPGVLPGAGSGADLWERGSLRVWAVIFLMTGAGIAWLLVGLAGLRLGIGGPSAVPAQSVAERQPPLSTGFRPQPTRLDAARNRLPNPTDPGIRRLENLRPRQ